MFKLSDKNFISLLKRYWDGMSQVRSWIFRLKSECFCKLRLFDVVLVLQTLKVARKVLADLLGSAVVEAKSAFVDIFAERRAERPRVTLKLFRDYVTITVPWRSRICSCRRRCGRPRCCGRCRFLESNTRFHRRRFARRGRERIPAKNFYLEKSKI